jgi:hypothetical protein
MTMRHLIVAFVLGCAGSSSACPKSSVPMQQQTQSTQIEGMVIAFEKAPNGTEVKINKGSAAGVAAGWTVTVRDKFGKIVSLFRIDTVEQRTSAGLSSVTFESFKSVDMKVILSPP